MATSERVAGPLPPVSVQAACEMLVSAGAVAAVLVEGWSDQAALEALARRRGWDLHAEGIVVVPIGGVTNVGRFVRALGPQGLCVRLTGLYDVAELPHVRRALEHAGMGLNSTHASTQAHGFFVCDADLEDELIRALGTAGVERVLESQGELGSFRSFQAQPAQRGRDHGAQLRRFMGTRAGRKIRYGSLLVEALDLNHVPRALDLALAHAREPRVPLDAITQVSAPVEPGATDVPRAVSMRCKASP